MISVAGNKKLKKKNSFDELILFLKEVRGGKKSQKTRAKLKLDSLKKIVKSN